jgi:cation diffusion facilitator family transporter
MNEHRSYRLPDEQRQALRRARRLEWIWMFFLATIVVAIYFTLGSSQAMKTAWLEDMLSFIPPISFLVASWVEQWKPNERYPLGYIRAVSIAYLVSAVALAGVALFMLYDSVMALIRAEHPTIGSVELFGYTFWFGWLMIAALAYSVVLPVIFGRLKLRPARQLHDKVLLADAYMNKADWMTGLAAAIGVLGIGLGWWWADAVAAIFIALDVLHDGYRHTMAAVRDLIDKAPRTVDDEGIDPLPGRAKDIVDALPWVRRSKIRFREQGRFLAGTIFVESQASIDPHRIAEAEDRVRKLNWRLAEISVVPLPDLSGIREQVLPDRA